MNRNISFMIILLVMIACTTKPVRVNKQNMQSANCIHNDLSQIFDFQTKINRIKTQNPWDSCVISVLILNKLTHKQLQEIVLTSNYLFDDCFIECNNVRSFITNKNIDSLAVDNDFGDLIVCDLNFDLKEDLAIKNSSGGNGGPTYNFYNLNKFDQFEMDKYLTDSMRFFPLLIDKKSKTLTTKVHANAYQYLSTDYVFNIELNEWKIIDSKLVDANK